MKDFIINFIIIFCLMFICFSLGRAIEKSNCAKRLLNEANACTMTMNLIKNDSSQFCAEEFEKMSC